VAGPGGEVVGERSGPIKFDRALVTGVIVDDDLARNGDERLRFFDRSRRDVSLLLDRRLGLADPQPGADRPESRNCV
jgi:hypothetical protein